MSSPSTTTISTATLTPTLSTQSKCSFTDRYGRPYWATTTSITTKNIYGEPERYFVTCMNVKTQTDQLGRPYLDDNTQLSIDQNQFITEYEEILYNKLQQLQAEINKLKVEIT